MRLFIAVNLSDRVKELVAKKVDLLDKNIKQNIKWVKKENWHITLKFLGEVKQSRVAKIKQSINNIIFNEQFYLQINKLGAFPSPGHPRVIYLGVSQGKNKIIKLQKITDDKMNIIDFDKNNKTYIPHITIARSKKSTDYNKLSQELKKFMSKNYFINIYSQVKQISLMKSDLFPEGPRYEEIFTKKI